MSPLQFNQQINNDIHNLLNIQNVHVNNWIVTQLQMHFLFFFSNKIY